MDEPAFPTAKHIGNGDFIHVGGMTLREWYTGQALASGLCPHNVYDHADVAKWCGNQADAMLKEKVK